ncbi:PepSY-associated TM helix domain-containing protein [uncultured Massilia sp.]|uniref:PepSY-associated TM helix domain-containing protein n=1 Tax=uncultured Massilia sp. TaxID=169973 RepID=UPI002600129A|nr:PepSY-associated TM helix domain-containing protein [uncultured Massilia sp.]
MPVIPFRSPRAPFKVEPPPTPSRRAVAVERLRRMHVWIGLWGAVLGLLLGGTAILLNHQASLQPASAVPAVVQVALPQPAPATPRALADWLGATLGLGQAPARVTAEAARPVAWDGRTLAQPARWRATFAAPSGAIQAEYWVGNQYVTVRRGGNDLFAALSNLHKATGMDAAWVLLVDMLAGSIMLLSLSGMALWALTSRLRTVGIAIGAASVLVALGALALAAL